MTSIATTSGSSETSRPAEELTLKNDVVDIQDSEKQEIENRELDNKSLDEVSQNVLLSPAVCASADEQPLEKDEALLAKFARLSIYSISASMVTPLMGFIDTAFLGHLKDINYLAGVILATVVFDYLYRSLWSIRDSTNTITSQAFGDNDSVAINLSLIRNGVIAVGLGLLILLFHSQIEKLAFSVLTSSPDIKNHGVEYFRARIWAAPAVLLNFTILGWLLGQEKNRAVLLISCIEVCLNGVLDYVMVVHMGWASRGAGLATAVSQCCVLLLFVVRVIQTLANQNSKPGHFFSKSTLRQVFAWKDCCIVLSLNADFLARSVIVISLYALMTNIGAAIGTLVLAQNALILQICSISNSAINGIGIVTQTLTGASKTRSKQRTTYKLLKTAVVVSVAIALVVSSISIAYPDVVFGLFTNHAEIVIAMREYDGWLLPVLLVSAVYFILDGYLMGLGYGQTIKISAVLSFCLVFSPLSYFSFHLHSNHLLWAAFLSYRIAVVFISLAFLMLTEKERSVSLFEA